VVSYRPGGLKRTRHQAEMRERVQADEGGHDVQLPQLFDKRRNR
jgi:hypothetical protein